MDLICFPYAGASSAIFRDIKKSNLYNYIDLEVPGRGRKINVLYENDIKTIVDELLSEYIPQNEYILFGHSMGAYLAYEFAQRVEELGFRTPKRLIISGQVHPEQKNIDRLNAIMSMDDTRLIEYLINFGGTDEDLFNNAELSEIILGIIRKDFEMVLKYERKVYTPISSEVHVYYGSRDTSISNKNIRTWDRFCKKEVRYKEFLGDHFFINKYLDKFNELILI